jgi:succinate-acetate transporter protein
MADVAEIRDYQPVERHASWTQAGPVVSHLPETEITTLEERAAATLGDSSTMALWGFATGTWMVATAVGGLIPHDEMVATAPVLFIFAGLAQFIGGLFAYRRANALAATAFCCFGAFNVTIAMTLLLQAAQLLPATPGGNRMLGFLLESFGFIALSLTIAAMRTNLVLVAVLGTLCVGYTLAGIANFGTAGATGVPVIGTVGAVFLLVSAACAYYAGAALLVNSTWNRRVLPIWGEP